MKQSFEELFNILENARSVLGLDDGELISRGKSFQHIKSGDRYTVVGVGFRELDMMVHVEYHPRMYPTIKFYRPLVEFASNFRPCERS